jgi:hypothetical protein
MTLNNLSLELVLNRLLSSSYTSVVIPAGKRVSSAMKGKLRAVHAEAGSAAMTN